MIYKYSVKKNPRILLLFFMAMLIPAGGFLTTLLLGPIIGIIAGVVGCVFSYHISRYAVYSTNSNINSHDDGLTITMPDREIIRFSWADISHSGLVKFQNNITRAFVYSEKLDKYVEITPWYTDFSSFLIELEEKSPYKEYQPENADTVASLLKRIIENKAP